LGILDIMSHIAGDRTWLVWARALVSSPRFSPDLSKATTKEER
jgi:hypothetical protein